MTVGAAPSQIAIELFGVRVLLPAGSEALVSALRSRLPPVVPLTTTRGTARAYTVETAEPPAHGFMVRRGARNAVLADSVEIAADLIVDDLQRTVAHQAEGLVVVHAGVVAWQGRALVLPGRSGSGKSELVAALVRAGATYLSDEFAVFDRAGLVHPYARPIALRKSDGTRAWLPVDSLRAPVASDPVTPGLIAFVRFAPGSRWRPHRLSAGETLLGLLRHTVAARRRLTLARSVLVPLVSSVAGVRALRDEAAAVTAALLEEVASGRAAGADAPGA